jgi:hypothetical protein
MHGTPLRSPDGDITGGAVSTNEKQITENRGKTPGIGMKVLQLRVQR